MKTKILLLCLGLSVLTLAFSACGNQDKKTTTTDQKISEKVVYTCTMHPEVISDKPGKCPKCGMDLVKKEPSKENSTMNEDSAEMKNMEKK